MGRTGGKPKEEENTHSLGPVRPAGGKSVPKDRLISSLNEEEEEQFEESYYQTRRRSSQRKRKSNDDQEYIPTRKTAPTFKKPIAKPRSSVTNTRSQIFKQPKLEIGSFVEKPAHDLEVRNLTVRAGRRIEFRFKSMPKPAAQVRLVITGLILRKGCYTGDQKVDDRHTYKPQPVPKVFDESLWDTNFTVTKEGAAEEHVTLLKVDSQSFSVAFLGELIGASYRCYHNYFVEVQILDQENWCSIACLNFSVFSNYKPDLLSKLEVDPNRRGNPKRPAWVDFENVPTRIVNAVTGELEEEERAIEEEGKEDVEPQAEEAELMDKRCFGSSAGSEGTNKRQRVRQVDENRIRAETPPPVPLPEVD